MAFISFHSSRFAANGELLKFDLGIGSIPLFASLSLSLKTASAIPATIMIMMMIVVETKRPTNYISHSNTRGMINNNSFNAISFSFVISIHLNECHSKINQKGLIKRASKKNATAL